jgi:DNA-binding IclR family transcriptional regulator
MVETVEKEDEVKSAEELEDELKESLKQAADGETISDTEEIKERVRQIRERS